MGIFIWRPGYDEIVCLCAPDAALPGAGAVAVIAGFVCIYLGRYPCILFGRPQGEACNRAGCIANSPWGVSQ